MRDAVEIDFTASRRSLVYKFGIRIGGCAVKAAPRIVCGVEEGTSILLPFKL